MGSKESLQWAVGAVDACQGVGACQGFACSIGQRNPASPRCNTTYGPIADWDVSAISDMSNLFKDLKYFNADISSWHTSGVTDMNWMFASAQSFNQPLSFDTSSVTTMESMFSWTASMSDTNRLLIRCAWAGN